MVNDMKKNRFFLQCIVGLTCALLCGCGEKQPQTENTESEVESVPAETEENSEASAWSEYEACFEGMEFTKSYKGILDTDPIMTQRFGADPYALSYKGSVYFYMTADAFEYDASGNIKENSYSQIRSLNVVSTEDMVNFTDHGSIQVAGADGAAKWAHNSWAPAAAWKEIDGKDKFFLYFADNGGGIGVLESDSPTGPFVDPLGKALISRDTPNCANVLWLFDPAVLVDDDGRAYLYFGGGVPEGKVADPGTARVVELGDDMISIKGEPKVIDVPYLFEDSGIHKAGNKYYYTYCTNWQVDKEGTSKYGFVNAEIACLESDSPMGPFTFKEVILENPGKLCGLYGNNHHCVFQFKDRWYITYHSRALEKAMGVEHGYRCTHISEFTMGEDGTIGKIRQSFSGREQLKNVSPYVENRAVTMAMNAGLDTVSVEDEDETFMVVTGIENGDYMKVQGVDFGEISPKAIEGTFRTTGGINSFSLVKVTIDSPNGKVLGYLPMLALSTERTKAGFGKVTCSLPEKVTGVHDLFFVFSGEGYEMKSWNFVLGSEYDDNAIIVGTEVIEPYCPDEVSAHVDGREYGTVEHISYASATTGTDRGANVLLPAGYSVDKKYPVLYVLHGIFGNEDSMLYEPNFFTSEIVGNTIAEGKARDMIVVFPNMYATGDPNLQPGFEEENVAPYDNFINDLVNDLIPYIEANYSVSSEKADRAIIGFSMGGRESLFIGLSRPDLFSAVGAISPAPGLLPAKDYYMVHVGQFKEEAELNFKAGSKPDMLFICCGDWDSVVGKFPRQYHEILEKNQEDHIWYEIPGADHDDKAIRSGIYNFIIRWKSANE